MKKRRIIALVCAVLMMCTLFTACNKKDAEKNQNSDTDVKEPPKNLAVIIDIDEETEQIRVSGGNADTIDLIGKDCLFSVNNASVFDIDGAEITFDKLKSGDSVEFELDGEVLMKNPVQAKVKSITKSYGAKYYADTAEAQMLKYSRALENSECNWIYALASESGTYEDFKSSEEIWDTVIIKEVTVVSEDVRAHKACYELRIDVENAGSSAFDEGLNVRSLWLECGDEGWYVYGLMTSGAPDEKWWNEGVGEYDSKVPSEALDELLAKITSAPSDASSPQDYIDAHPDEYKSLVGMNERALFAIFSKFEQGGQDGLEGAIMAVAAADILNEEYGVSLKGTGQEWYDEFKAHTMKLFKDKSKDYIRENLPKTAVLFDVIDNSYTGIEINAAWEYEGESHPLSYRIFPNVWNGVSYDRETYRQALYKTYVEKKETFANVPDGAKITIEFHSNFPESVSLIKDPYVFVENSKLDAMEDKAEYIRGENTVRAEFSADYGDAKELCYVATAKWDNGNSVEITLVFQK